MFWLLASGKPRCDEITPFGLRLRNLGFLDGLDRLLKAQVVEQVAPAPNPLGQLDELHQGEATAEFVQGTCPVDAVEEETPVPVRGDDNRIPLHGLVRDLRGHAGETGGSWSSWKMRHESSTMRRSLIAMTMARLKGRYVS